MEFFLKIAGCNLTKKGLHQRFYPIRIRKFIIIASSQYTFRSMLLFRELALWSPNKVASISFIKKINNFTELFCKIWSTPRLNVRDGQVKVTQAGFRHFFLTFSTFSEQPFCISLK